MKILFTKKPLLKIAAAVMIALPLGNATAQQPKPDARMDAFINALMKKMTVDEKIGQLNLVTSGMAITGSVTNNGVDNGIANGHIGGIFGLYGIENVRKAQQLAVKNSRLHIPLIFGLDVIHGHRTIFPIPLGMSATWDLPLIQNAAHIAAKEATAEGLNWVFSPMVDIARDARWGRISEGSGEDPFLGGKIAGAMVRGYQGTSLRNADAVIACVKHFALYGGAEAGREYNTVDMSRLQMYQDYLPPYKAAVDAGAGSIMSSFNTVDGIPSTGNKWLLTDLLRKQWGFKGFVVSDYTSLSEMTNHGLGDLPQVSAIALKAGLDMDMVAEGFLNTLKKSLQQGKVTQGEIDLACRRVLEAKYKLGLFDNPYKSLNADNERKDVFTDDNRKAARIAAEHSFVLLKNAGQILPLKKSGGTIAVVGPLADNKRDMLGTWVIAGEWEKSVSVLEGIKHMVGDNVKLLYAKGSNITDDTEFMKRLNFGPDMVSLDTRTPQEMIDEAVNTAKKADIIVAVVGESQSMSGESSSRSDISIPESQKNLLKALAKLGKPIVMVLFNGRPLTLTWENENAAAILDVWAPGTEAGNAIGEVLFGNYNPSGKLTATFPRSVGQIPIYYNHKNTGRPYTDGPTKFKSNYLDISNDPLFPFGYGLSYTSFSYSDVKLNKTNLKGNVTLTATVTITNTGSYAGEEVVQLYISDPVASISRSVKELKDFRKLKLAAGEVKEVTFSITTEQLKFYNSQLKYDWEPGEFVIQIGTNSADTHSAKVNWLK
ncbi:beta-glucosidase BglX [Mucilaginibacter psychrotolerans]|uniref:Periplasmic beta-glucosidase n=1 Tax=Mucilaginibacter psychrotolerans TaxID=1524096 RepID=A0A4Y8S2C0_9SPHI|nr:beta-glucosidase BglX [Mucilaginibacter psychrotolerans]TFF32157.1 beta-glucosidase BglX [Mucilaginibacter psychrotolerans]